MRVNHISISIYDWREWNISMMEIGWVASFYFRTVSTVSKATACIAPMTDKTHLLRLLANLTEFPTGPVLKTASQIPSDRWTRDRCIL